MKGNYSSRAFAPWVGAVSAIFAAMLGMAIAPTTLAAEVTMPAPPTPSATPVSEAQSMTLRDIGAEQPVRLRGAEQQVEFPFAIRNDEVVTKARVHLRYAHSPALIFEWSHLSVLVNNEVMGNVQLRADTANGGEATVDIDPRAMVGYSKLGLRAVMHYTRECEDPWHSTLWTVIGNESTLELEVQRIGLKNDLSRLPEPFFDPRDRHELVLPFVLPAEPTTEELQAAGMIASWFGALAEYRGASFPVQLGRLPAKGNAVTIATRTRLGNAVQLTKANGAQISLAGNPTDPSGQLLVVTGDDATTLLAAARALTLGTQALSGESSVVKDLTEPPARKAYDAPRWVPTDRVVQIGERISPSQLQVRGPFPPAIRVPWDLPPDLFYWKNKGALFDVGYRYSLTTREHSILDLDVNDQFSRATPLRSANSPEPVKEKIERQTELPEVAKREKFYVPAYKFASDNEVRWQFTFDLYKRGECEQIMDPEPRGSIDPDSTIDLSNLPHFTYLPDLKLFVDGAFPFSKYADLAQTIAVLPSKPSAAEVSSFLNVMGHIGDATGLAATRLRVSDASTVEATRADADLLVFGTPKTQPLLAHWSAKLPVKMEEDGTQLQVLGNIERLRARFQGRDLEGAWSEAGRMILEAGKGLGTIMSFESPLVAKRTVVIFAAPDDARLMDLSSALDDPKRSPQVDGDLVLFNGNKISHYELAQQYGAGRLPFTTGVRWWFAKQPFILSIAAVLLSLLLAIVLYRLLRERAQARRDGR